MLEALFRCLPRSLDSVLQPVDSALRGSCYPAVLLAQNVLFRLTSVEGVTRTGNVRVLVSGSDSWAHELPLRLFSSPPQQSILGRAPLWRLDSTIQKMERDFDLVVARVDTVAARLFFPSTYLRIPEWIDTGRTIPDNPASLLRASESLTRDIRVIRQNGLETERSWLLDDFDEFYRSMYLPFIRLYTRATSNAGTAQKRNIPA